MVKTDYYEKLAYMMSKARTDAKLSQKEMAVKMNVCANTIKNWEGLATVPDAVQVIMWFEALQLNKIFCTHTFRESCLFLENQLPYSY